MGRSIFSRWLDGPSGRADPKGRGVRIDERFVSWAALAEKAAALAETLAPGTSYLVDPGAGHDAFLALLAVARVPDATLIWGRPGALPLTLTPRGPGVFACPAELPDNPGRPRYATATSGTAGAAKIPVAYGDVLELVALQYDFALYQNALAGQGPVRVLATCLPLEYAAVFMMLVVPAMFMAHDVVIFSNHRWRALHAAAAREPVACLAVPALAAAAHAGTVESIDMSRASLIFTAGYLSQARAELIRSKFRGVTLLGSYGASETGVMTLDAEPEAHAHVGRPIAGKALWIADPDENGIGKVATTGPDCREYYLGQPGLIRDARGVVSATDYGHFDADGNLYLDGRVDDGGKLHGITIYPRQIERHILMLPGVEDVRIRISATNGYDRLEALVVGTVRREAVREHCGSLPDTCRPALIECVPETKAGYSMRGKL